MLWGCWEQDKEILKRQAQAGFEEGENYETLLNEARKIEREEARPLCLRRAEIIRMILSRARVGITPEDWFADRLEIGNPLVSGMANAPIIGSVLRPEAIARCEQAMGPLFEETRPAVGALLYTGDGDFSHTAPDWNNVLALGLPGLKARAERAAAAANGEQKDFYESIVIAYEGALCCVGRLAALCERHAAENEKMPVVARALRALTERAPQTFYEALQLIYLYFIVQSNVECSYLRSFGRLDQLLWPFYERDLAEKRLTRAQAAELIRYFIEKLDAPHVGANQPFALGCIRPDGTGAVNELSYLIRDEFLFLAPVYTKIHLRWTKELPEDFLRPIFESIRAGANSFVFLNSPVAARSLETVGVAHEDAVDYGIVGCYELIVPGKELPCTCNARVNLLKALELTLTGGCDLMTGKQLVSGTGQDADFASFDELMTAYHAVLDEAIDRATALTNAYEREYPRQHVSPFLSSTYDHAMAVGKDVYHGGAVYNTSSLNAFGTANAADALTAIRLLVYETHELTLPALTAILRENWRDHEALRLKIEKKLPKYGNFVPEADAPAADLLAYCASRVNGRSNGRGGSWRLGSFSIDWRGPFGEATGASADGRRQGEMLAKNVCAATARDRSGATAHLLSAAQLPYEQMPNGTVLDLPLHYSAVAGEDGLRALMATLPAFMNAGGFAIQYNVLNPAILRKAQEHPERYASLQVRLCGWNVRFIDLTKAEQDDFIRQSEALQ